LFTSTLALASWLLATPPFAMLTVPLVVIGPPVSPVPVATFVTVPPLLLSFPHVHALPFHFGICVLVHATVGSSCVLARLIVPVLVIGPPLSPAPVATLVTVPLALATSRHDAVLIAPLCAVVFATSRFAPHALSTAAAACNKPVPFRVIALSRTYTLDVPPLLDIPAALFSLATDCVITTVALADAPGALATPAPFFVTLDRSIVTCAFAPAALGETPIPAVALLENSLSRTSTATVPALGCTLKPSAFERDTVPEMRTELPP
jgi:hypothetical protein